MKFKLPKISKLPKLPNLPRLKFEPAKKMFDFLFKHKVAITILVCVIAFIIAAMWYRGYLLSKMNTTANNTGNQTFYSTKTDNNPIPTVAIPFPSPSNDNNSVLGTSSYSDPNYDLSVPSPFPTFPVLPTLAPVTITTTNTNNNSSSSNNNNNNSGNPNCTTGSGVANGWYSDVYPNPPVTTSNGSITLIVYIRDCNKNTAPVNDNLTITLTSNDSTAKINGAASPVNIQAQNGQVSFTVSSQNTITDTFTVQDTSNNFTITDINNHNPSVSFTNSNSGGNSTGNSNCATANGVPNFWYSDVSPASPITANTGTTVTLTVSIKDCGKNNVSSDNLTITQTSSDSSLKINNSSSPASVQAQNGQATFNIISQNAGTDTFTIQDTTSNFAVTDANNQNPKIIFSGSSSNPTPTPTPVQSTTPTPTPTPTNTPTPTP